MCLGGLGLLGVGMVPTGAALTATMRRTPVAFIAATMAGVPWEAIPASELECGPRAESTASVPVIADSRAAGSGAAMSVVTVRTWRDRLAGLRTTAVTS